MKSRFILVLLILIIIAGFTRSIAAVKAKFVAADAVAGQILSSRPEPARITQESEEALIKRGFVRIGEISVEEVAGTYWGSGKVPETKPSRDLTTPLLLRAAKQGGDLVVLVRNNSYDSYQVTKRGKVIRWKRESRISYYITPHTEYYNVPTLWEYIKGTECAVRSTGTVWRDDPVLARSVSPKMETERQARLQRQQTVSETDRQALLLLQEAELQMVAERPVADIHDAALANDVEEVRALLAKGVDAKSKNETGDTPLHLAASGGAVDAAKLLLIKGADVNAKGFGGTAPLHYAAMANSKAVAEILLAHGADVNRISQDGMTAMHLAAGSDAGDVADLLLANGADVNARSINGLTPLHLTAMNNAQYVAELLLANGADMNAKASNEMTPLHVAASRNAKEVAELLLAKGAKLNAKDKNGMTPFDLAVRGGHGALAKMLRTEGSQK